MNIQEARTRRIFNQSKVFSAMVQQTDGRKMHPVLSSPTEVVVPFPPESGSSLPLFFKDNSDGVITSAVQKILIVSDGSVVVETLNSVYILTNLKELT